MGSLVDPRETKPVANQNIYEKPKTTDAGSTIEVKDSYYLPYTIPPNTKDVWVTITTNYDSGNKENKKYGIVKLSDGYLVNIAILIPGDKIEEDFLEDFKEFAQKMGDILARKRHDYGTNNINALGIKGIFVRMFDKVNRLKRLVWDGVERQVKEETVDDTLLDLANYAFIMYRVRKRGAF